jgi:hypothetical protein
MGLEGDLPPEEELVACFPALSGTASLFGSIAQDYATQTIQPRFSLKDQKMGLGVY